MTNSKAIAPVTGGNGDESRDRTRLDPGEYEALLDALMQSWRGRAFLEQYLCDNGKGGNLADGHEAMEVRPASDTERILQAVNDLHKTIISQHQNTASQHVRMDILEIARAITRTRREIAAIRTDGGDDHIAMASEEMDAIVLATERATNDILMAAEKIQETVWPLREAGAGEAECEEIENLATDIFTACSFQDITGQRTSKVVKVLQYIEARVNSMIEIWGLEERAAAGDGSGDGGRLAGEAGAGQDSAIPPALEDDRPDAHLLNGPQMEDKALGQENIDELMGTNFSPGDDDDIPEEISELDGMMAMDGELSAKQPPAMAAGGSEEQAEKGAEKQESPGPGEVSVATSGPEAEEIAAAGEPMNEEQLKALFG